MKASKRFRDFMERNKRTKAYRREKASLNNSFSVPEIVLVFMAALVVIYVFLRAVAAIGQ